MQTASKTYTMSDGRRYRYRYRAVTRAGTAVHSIAYVVMSAAEHKVEGIKSTWPDAELQRVREILVGDVSCAPADEVVWGRQYELRRNGRWVEESKARDMDERNHSR